MSEDVVGNRAMDHHGHFYGAGTVCACMHLRGALEGGGVALSIDTDFEMICK